MASKLADGTDIQFAGTTLNNVTRIQVQRGSGEVEVSGLADTEELYEALIDAKAITVESMGVNTLTRGSTGALTISPPVGSALSLTGTWQVMQADDEFRHKQGVVANTVIKRWGGA